MNFREYTIHRVGRSDKLPTYPTLNDPVLLFNRFRIYEVFGTLAALIFFGVIQGAWLMSLTISLGLLVGSPTLRKKLPPSQVYRMYLDRFSKLPLGKFSWGRVRGGL